MSFIKPKFALAANALYHVCRTENAFSLFLELFRDMPVDCTMYAYQIILPYVSERIHIP